ncbi:MULTISPECIES: hypothetical protein [Mycolicibacterium]|uniref:hypothetical protein n=1 Tax=Mycolicibacterium TaxID=1866885 RepID=UPI001CDD080B|nr:hypothetical protein [Mycolicibacterium fortuitum]UBV20423.1 hypothetical protein H8Z59_24645 [Mycolicibacterium fortuitum]
MYENEDAPTLSELLDQALAGGAVGASIDRLSLLLLRAVIAKVHPEAAELSMDWYQDGLGCDSLYDGSGNVIDDFDALGESYPEDLWALASNVRGTSDVKDILIGPGDGPFRLKIR